MLRALATSPHALFQTFMTSKLIAQNQLKDNSVIQLYHKPSMMYLCLTNGGKIRTSDKSGSELIDDIDDI